MPHSTTHVGQGRESEGNHDVTGAVEHGMMTGKAVEGVRLPKSDEL